MIPLLLLGLTVGLAAVAPARLARAGWAYRSPHVGMVAWQAAALTTVISAIAAAWTLIMPWHAARDTACTLWRVCVDALSGAHSLAALVVAWSALVGLAAGLARLAAAAVTLAGQTRQRHRHAVMIRLIGHRRPGVAATVVEHPDPAVYLVPGRAGEVVVTSAALSRLNAEELAAVLAHEHAHARDRHHHPLALTDLLHRAYPTIALFGEAYRQISRLAEMSADDYACRVHSRLALARALVALAVVSPPAGTLGASGGGDAVERVHRLMSPPPPVPRRAQIAAVAGLLALPLMPVAIVLAVPVAPLLSIGLPL